MGQIRTSQPVLLLIAAFAPSEKYLDAGKGRAVERFGPVWKESAAFRVEEFTQYYNAQMGPALWKKFWAFEHLIDAGELAEIKILTNHWEEEFSEIYRAESGVERPVNLDPGYIDLGKLVLASTKDHGHRIYLGRGIFAEITLSFSQKRWQSLPWTYADYRRAESQTFFDECRNHLHTLRRAQ